MSTFAELAAKTQGVGVAFLLEGSVDLFVNVPYKYSTHDGLFGGSEAFDPRIVEMGDLQRGFGVDGVLASSTVALRLANTDGTLDFLITSPTILFKVRWRLSIALYDSANPSDLATKVLGIFVNLDNPQRDGASVTLNLADDSFGQAAEMAIPPTAGEAFAVALNSSSNEPPVPVAFGEQIIPAYPRPYLSDATSIDYVLSATTDTAAITAGEVEYVSIRGTGLNTFGQTALLLRPNETYRDKDGSTISLTLWAANKTASLAKDGRTWRVIYITLYVENLKLWLSARGHIERDVIKVGGIYDWPIDVGQGYFNNTLLPMWTIEAKGPRWASRTYTTTGLSTTVRAPDIAYDLLRYYSRGLTAGQVNQSSFTAATAAAPMFFFKARYYFSNFTTAVLGVSDGGALGRRSGASLAVSTQGLLRQAISDLCQGGFFDVVTDWDGQFVAHVLANTFALQTETPHEVDETLLVDVSDRVPSSGERWAPYNRVIFQSDGRIVDNNTAITEWGVVIVRSVNDVAVDVFDALSGTDFGIGTFGGVGVLESKVRPIISFDYPLDALTWELGDFISVSWTRGGSSSPWVTTVFRVESLTLHPARGTVSVQAVWIQDLRDELPYILDNETYVEHSDLTLFGDAVSNGLGIITFNAGVDITNLYVGAIIVLRDSTEAADAFTRNGAWRITAFDPDPAGPSVTVATNAEGIYPAAGVVAFGQWGIYFGASNVAVVAADPVLYPSGALIYGKMAEGTTFSDSSTANVLKAG